MANSGLVTAGVQGNTSTVNKNVQRTQNQARPSVTSAVVDAKSGDMTGAMNTARQLVGLGSSGGGAMGSPTGAAGALGELKGGNVNGAQGILNKSVGNAMGSPTGAAAGPPQYTNKRTTEGLYDENGNTALRQGLVNRGVDTNRIGWDMANGLVTIDGIGVTAPGYVKDGVSYGNNAALNQLTNQAYEQMGDRIVGAASYASESGLGNLVKWDQGSGTVSIGGTPINPVYVENGIAYVRQSDIDKAISQAKENANIKPADMYDQWAREYIPQVTEQWNKYRDFSYDPNKDKEYQAYAKLAMQQKYKTAQDAAARAADLNGGYGGVNARSIAGELFNSQQKVAEAIPQYAQQAYDRVRNQFTDSADYANFARQYADQQYQINRDAIEDYRTALDTDYQRFLDERDWSETQADRRQTEIENKSTNYRNAIEDEYYRPEKEQEYKYNEGTITGQDIANRQSRHNLEASIWNDIDAIARKMGRYPQWDAVSGQLGFTIPGPDGQDHFMSLSDMGWTGFPSHPYQEDYYSNYYSTDGNRDAELEYQKQYLPLWAAYSKMASG